jgi:hypothetical protein
MIHINKPLGYTNAAEKVANFRGTFYTRVVLPRAKNSLPVGSNVKKKNPPSTIFKILSNFRYL